MKGSYNSQLLFKVCTYFLIQCSIVNKQLIVCSDNNSETQVNRNVN